MSLARLKKVRIAVSILFFALTAFLFLDFKSFLPLTVNKYVLYLQFVPSVLKFINVFSLLAAAGFIFVIVLSLFFGRVYCSTICPLGTLQDLAIYFSRKFRRKKKSRFHYLKANNFLRYGFLAISVIPVFFGSMFALDLLDPYSNFGKISANLFRPVVVFLNNSAAYALEKFQNYSLYPFELRTVSLLGAVFSLFFLALVIIMSVSKGRLYCNSICPVGTLLGLLSRFSFFKIAIDQSRCKGCGICEKSCKSGCIDNKSRTVDYSRCVSCFDCFNVCPSQGIGYLKPFKKKSNSAQKETDYAKREFIFKTSAYILGLSGFAFLQKKPKSYKNNSVPTTKQTPLTPPGSMGIEHFTSTCTACHLCISACPAQVLQPSYLEFGLRGMMQPHMDYRTSFCNFECVACTEVCPNGAILPLTLEQKKLTQLGKVRFVKDDCIVKTENTDCGACSEHCPTKAVNMVPYIGKLSIPQVNDEICIGCGACEYACPAKPFKAIYVEGNPVHLKAKKPEIKKLEEKVDYKEDFPF
ncbi:MAG: 4Fe-4S binding protein [Ignavibacteria bacterium]|jgi:ferredoxin|nr:4Fe-4S binding protein [Ignavibacteria bacterium]MCU7502174.1 4Fe-4S binding protein [Ignavibacteria bacterium]MCU7517391.1 4Fe-4S binding protein [Ignavibacteria bacterium]